MPVFAGKAIVKVITRGVIDWASLKVEEEESFDYEGPIAEAKSSGSAPQPVDPWQQAAAQYALSTGTANFNANLNRTNTSNPLGSSGWEFSGGSAPPPSPATSPYTYSPNGTVGERIPYRGAFGLGGTQGGIGTVAPSPPNTYTTQLAPQFESVLQKPIDTSQIPGMPGSPSLTDSLSNAQKAVYNQQMGYLAPEQALQSEQLDSQLANEGLMPGSAGYANEEDRLAREQTFAKQQAADSAIGAGQNLLGEMYGLGSESLQNQEGLRNNYINEFNSLNGSPAATAGATTPDISGAFGQQYQGELAGYNANVSSNNATESTVGSLALAAAMYF